MLPLLAALAIATPPSTATAPPPLETALLEAVRAAGFDAVRDAGPDEGPCPGAPACPVPLPVVAGPRPLDVAVIRLDAEGRALEAASVRVDAASPQGRVVALDANLAAAEPFEAPYPASLFKLPVAFHAARLWANGRWPLDAVVPAPADPSLPPARRAAWLDRMVTRSDNAATRAILADLLARGEVERMNAGFEALGLGSLRVTGLRANGSRWAPGEIRVTAIDVARLLWLVAGGPGTLWTAPSGRAVTRADLPGPARALLLRLLEDQAFHEALSGGSLCGEAPAGIPARVPGRFLDPATGVERIDGQDWRRDVRPCNTAAEVRFLHKTGLTWNYASDAGIVESLPGKPFRRYVVAAVTAVGTRYLDPVRAAAPRHPCEAEGVCLSRALARLGGAIDAWMVARTATP
ncbi:MAG: serine hydrolase [Anaeromyxobacter sp.]